MDAIWKFSFVVIKSWVNGRNPLDVVGNSIVVRWMTGWWLKGKMCYSLWSWHENMRWERTTTTMMKTTYPETWLFPHTVWCHCSSLLAPAFSEQHVPDVQAFLSISFLIQIYISTHIQTIIIIISRLHTLAVCSAIIIKIYVKKNWNGTEEIAFAARGKNSSLMLSLLLLLFVIVS